MFVFKLQNIHLKDIISSKLEFYADKENNFNRYVSTWNFTIMIKFKLQDINAKNMIFQVGNSCQRQKNDDKLVFSGWNCLI